jgi:molybdate transport system substrate-binding protein
MEGFMAHPRISGLSLISACLLLAGAAPAAAGEIKLLAPVSLRALLPESLPQFQTASGHKVTVGYATLGAITKRVSEGETADVAMGSPEQNADLLKQGKLLAGSGVEIARVGFMVFVKKGAPKPDVSSVDALKRTLLSAKSIALGDPAGGGGSGVYLAGLMQKLELAADIKAKTKLFPSGTEVAEAVAKGDTEIGIGVASDAAIVPGLDATPLPTGAQSYSIYMAGITAGSQQVDGSKALLTFLTSPAMKQKLMAQSFEVR